MATRKDLADATIKLLRVTCKKSSPIMKLLGQMKVIEILVACEFW